MGRLWSLPLDSYKGLKARCAPGLHPAAVALLLKHQPPRTSVLDLASGSGSLLARLEDAGFSDLHAAELDVPKFQFTSVTPMPLDLNAEFSEKLPRQYNLITAIEIIEHLDSPRHFLASIHQSLAAEGMLLLSTPNIAAWLGRLKFLMSGTLRQFDEAGYQHNHHVSPVPHLQMLHLFGELGFELVDYTTAGSFFGPLKRLATWPASLAARVFMGAGAEGDVNLYLARKGTPPPRAIPGDWTHPPLPHDRCSREARQK